MRDITLFSGGFGLERETLRVDSRGRMAETPHPFPDTDSCITRDFCENQLELITSVCASPDEALDSLSELDRRARQVLSQQGEEIWLYSNPPGFDTEDDILIADFTGDQSSKRSYREKLRQRYGKRLMLYSGIHFNYSMSPELLERLRNEAGSSLSPADFRDQTYLRLKKQLMRHSWLIVLLTAASPVYHRSMDQDFGKGAVFAGHSSLRNSSRGYWNNFVPVLDHSSVAGYTASIQRYIDKGALFSISELYLPIRLKPRGVNTLSALAESGVDHIELRMFDLDPTEPLGISREALRFTHLLMIYLLSLPDFDYTPALQRQAVEDHQAAAMLDMEKMLISGRPAKSAALDVLEEISRYFAEDEEALRVIETQRQKILGKRPAQLVLERIRSEQNVEMTGCETDV